MDHPTASKQNIRTTLHLQPQSKTFGPPYSLKAKHSDHPTASKQNIWTTQQPQSKTFGPPYSLKAKHLGHPTAKKLMISLNKLSFHL